MSDEQKLADPGPPPIGRDATDDQLWLQGMVPKKAHRVVDRLDKEREGEGPLAMRVGREAVPEIGPL